jgi:molybdopterin-containing oxidoreductase family iron-sulfur binding subunit
MSINRRDFLKIAGVSAFMSLGGVSVIQQLWDTNVEAAQISPDPRTLTGKRWGIAIDMSKFKTESDYKALSDACHSIHNVPVINNPNHEIKWIWPETFEHAFPGQEDEYLTDSVKHLPFPLLCNHCENPPCVRVCPTQATFKRSDGIVMMDMHRCIGCRFCMAACPFGARSFNFIDPRPYIKEQNKEFPTRTKGVVEKCTLCYERLAKGNIPACVEASKGAMVFGDLADPNSDIRKVLGTRYSIRRKAELGTKPSIYYLI